MSFGPELVWIWKQKLSSFVGRRVQKAEGADLSAALSFGAWEMLFCWDAQRCGVSVVSQKERKKLFSAQQTIPPITNALKSHIIGAELTNVEQINRDKILKFSFKKSIGAGFTVNYFLIAEVMDRYSNLILTDENCCIIETAKHIHPCDNAFRTVLPGLPYHLPPQFTGTALEDWLDAHDIATVRSIAGFGKKFLTSVASLSQEEAAALLSLYYKDDEGTTFCAQNIGNYVTSAPRLLPSAQLMNEEDTGRYITLKSLGTSTVATRKKQAISFIQKEITRRERQTEDINRLILDDKPEIFKKYGELIVSNLWNLNKNVSSANLTGYDSNGSEYTMNVPFDSALSPKKNAEVYFAKYKKLTASSERAAQLLPKIKCELNDLYEELVLVSSVTESEELSMIEEELGIAKKHHQRSQNKKKEILPPHRRFELSSAIVFAGLSAKGNRYVTFKAAQPDDIWFHAQGVPGSHVIMRVTAEMGEEELENVMFFCASLAAFHSKSNGENNVRVDYTKRKYVSPIRGGIANVTYKEFSTIYASPNYWQTYVDTK